MAFPAQLRSYSFSLNNRISFVSLNDTMSRYLFGIKNFLVATMGYTVKYTCDGTTGPTSSSDHTDRWASQANVVTRGAAAGNAQSFCVLTDADGADIMLTYQGASDDICRASFSQGGLFLPAATANQQPTATDEIVIFSGNTVIAATASADRVWNIMAASDKKSFRVCIARSNIFVGYAWGVETFTSALVSPAVLSPAKCAHAINVFAPATWIGSASATTHAIFARPTMSGVGVSVTAGFGIEGPASGTFIDGVNCELQGSNGSLLYPLSAWSNTANAQGKLGNLIDYYKSAASKSDGDVSSDKKWIQLTGSASAAAGALWPWDGATTPVLA